MSQGLDYSQPIEIPFSKGQNNKADPRLIEEPELVRAVDVDFDNLGGLRLRYPYASIGTDIFGGGTISDCRRIYSCGDELLLFTETALYSWSSQRSAWVSRGTHLAVKVEEEPAFITNGEQTDCDRAELSGTVCHVWVDAGAVYYGLTDKDTGAVLVTPAAITGAVSRPRVVATTTKLLVFYVTSTPTLLVRSIDPSTGSLSNATTVMGANFGSYYDVVKTPGADSVTFAARRNPTTSYEVGKVTGALVVTQSTKARDCDWVIAVAVEPSTGLIQIAREVGTDVIGDQLTSAFVDSAINHTIGGIGGTTDVDQLTVEWADDGFYVFWSFDESSDATDFYTAYNRVTTGGSVGVAAVFGRRLGIASRAFAYDGDVYVWLSFAGASGTGSSSFRAQLQNTYFLYKDDLTLHAKCAAGRAGGFAPTAGRLPGVALTSGTTEFSWCASERRIIPLGENHLGYADRGPRDVTFTFDSNDARRVAKLGSTLYITGGEILQYDGVRLTEVGYHVYPWYFIVGMSGAGSLADGTYAYKTTWRWDNAAGERDRSTTATALTADISGGPAGVVISSSDFIPLYVTHKTANAPAVEVWRTPVSPTDDSPFYLVTSQDPTATSNPNRYLPNDPSAAGNPTFNDRFADSTLTTKEPFPESGSVLENLAPPPATLIVANDTRLFLAGVAGDPHRIWYSKQRVAGHVASFNDALVVDVPEPGGAITGLAFLNETLVVFRETAIYALDGLGYDNTGGGQNYQARLVSTDCGAVSQEAIALTPMGLAFKSSKGWFVLNRGWSAQYIGGRVRDEDGSTIYAAHSVESEHQLRIVGQGFVLMYDYLADAWATWTVSGAVHACVWNGVYHYVESTAVNAQQDDYATADYGWDVEMLVHLGGLQRFGRLRRILLLGEVRGEGTIQFQIGSYAEGTYFDDRTWTISPTSVGSELSVEHCPSQQQHKAFRIRLTSQTDAGEKAQLSALSLEVGFKGGLHRLQPASQKQ